MRMLLIILSIETREDATTSRDLAHLTFDGGATFKLLRQEKHELIAQHFLIGVVIFTVRYLGHSEHVKRVFPRRRCPLFERLTFRLHPEERSALFCRSSASSSSAPASDISLVKGFAFRLDYKLRRVAEDNNTKACSKEHRCNCQVESRLAA
jgi:hypothetical protein